jgi:hypothetical protein
MDSAEVAFVWRGQREEGGVGAVPHSCMCVYIALLLSTTFSIMRIPGSYAQVYCGVAMRGART